MSNKEWKSVAVLVVKRLGLSETMADTPTRAASVINIALDTLEAAVRTANTQVQSAAMYGDVITNQGRVLDAFASVLGLPQGKLYSDMIPMLREIMAKAGVPEMQDAPPQPPPGTTVQ